MFTFEEVTFFMNSLSKKKRMPHSTVYILSRVCGKQSMHVSFLFHALAVCLLADFHFSKFSSIFLDKIR